MSVPTGKPDTEEIARIAHAIWEAEGQPEGRDHEHWMRAKQLIEEGRADIEFPAAATDGADNHAPRPVQPGFTDAAPGVVPVMKPDAGKGLKDDAGGRFAQQLADLPEEDPEHPGPRNPAPEPATNADGYVAIPDDEDEPNPKAPAPM